MNEILVQQILSTYIVINGARDRYIEIVPLRRIPQGTRATFISRKGERVSGRIVQPANMGDFVTNSPQGAQIVDTKAT